MSEDVQPQPEPAPAGPLTWSLTAALAFVVLWVLIQFLVQVVLLTAAAILTALRSGISVEAAAAELQQTAGDPSLAVLIVGASLLSWFATFALVRLLFVRYSRAAILDALGLRPAAPRWSLAVAIPAGFVLLIVGNLLMEILRVSEDPTPLDRLLTTPEGAIAVAVLAVGIAPAGEEIFFRGFLLPPMARRFSAGTAMALNGAVFALVHLMTYGSELGYLPPIFLLGFVLSGMRLWTGSIWPAIIAHLVFNGVSLVAYFIAPESSM